MKRDMGKICSFWNSRGGLGKLAGSRDVMAKEIEIREISKFIGNGMRVLDLGCGNGITAIEFARHYNIRITGIDYAEEMITAAKDLVKGKRLKGKLDFMVGDITKMPELKGAFDRIYTERVIINLKDWKAQAKSIRDITSLLKKNGVFVMCENSQDGLDKINELRECAGLDEIKPPWHNRYLRDKEVGKLSISGVKLEKVVCYSSTYYLLSRVINAWLAKQEGKEPSYNAPVNKLALELPSIGEFGQGRIWLWKKVK